MKHAIKLTIVRVFTAVVLISLILLIPTQVYAAPGDETSNPQLSLLAAIEAISVSFSFDGDNNGNNQASMYYRQTGTSSWKPGIQMTVDRRSDLVIHGQGAITNPYRNEWRAIIFELNPSTSYDVRIDYTDVDGGSSSIQGTVTTQNDNPSSNGSIYYVSTSGSDTSGTGSQSSPWRTIQKAADNVSPGDRVRIMPGTYNERVIISTSGTVNNYITFESYDPNNLAVITHNSRGTFYLDGTDYIRLRNLDVRTTANDGECIAILNNAIGNIVEDCEIDIGTGDNWWCGGVWLQGDGNGNSPSYTLIQNNIFTTQGYGRDGPFGVMMWRCDIGGTTIKGNHISGDFWDGISTVPNYGLDSKGNYFIYDNTLSGCVSDCIEAEGGGMNVGIWNNTITDYGNMGIAIAACNVGPMYVFRNTFHSPHNGQACFKLGADSYGSMYFYHNTLYHIRQVGFATYGDNAIVDNAEFRNNIIEIDDQYANYVIEETTGGLGRMDFDYNSMYSTVDSTLIKWMGIRLTWSEWRANYNQEAHGIWGQESYVNAAGGNFHLQSNSIGIDKGVVLPGFNDANSPWPYSGNGPDIGAFEYTGIPAADNTPPYTIGHNPQKYSNSVAPNTNIMVHVCDSGSGVDQSSIIMRVNGSLVSPTITGNTYDYMLTYNPPVDFSYGQRVDVTVDASDLESNDMTQDAYYFTIQDEGGDPEPPDDPEPPTGELQIPFRVNCGGPGYMDVYGNLWNADQQYVAGEWGAIAGNTSDFGSSLPISNTQDDRILQTERYALTGYTFDIGNGTYDVTLLFAENFWDQSGERVFDVIIEGQVRLANLDVYSIVGRNTAFIHTISGVTVNDGQLNITFNGYTDYPFIGGIQITASGGSIPDGGEGDNGGTSGGGGTTGGGGSIPVDDDNVEVTSVMNSVNTSGKFTEEVTARSSDNRVRIVIPEDTVGTNVMGLRLLNISIERMTINSPKSPDDAEIVGWVYNITPDGARFNPAISLIIRYYDSQVPDGVSEKNLVIGTYNPDTGDWQIIPSSTNLADNEVSANLEHFSTYAILAYTRPANFKIEDISTYPDIVTCGNNIDIQATVTNTGDITGDYEVCLVIDGEVFDTQIVTLDGGDSTTVIFSTVPDVAGVHTISIGLVEEEFTAEPLITPAKFITSNITVTPQEIYLGDSVDVSTLISNIGDLSGIYEVIVKMDNEIIDNKTVEIDGHDSEIIIFSVTPETEGEHAISIGDKIRFFTVKSTVDVDPEIIAMAKPEISRFDITPTYDPGTGKIESARIDYQLINTENLDPGAKLILKVYYDGELWEEIELVTLNQLDTDEDTGYLNYAPEEDWNVGTYIFEGELQEQDGIVHSIKFEKFTLIEESITRAISWGSLGIIIGGTLIVLLTVLAIVIYRRREMLRGYVE